RVDLDGPLINLPKVENGVQPFEQTLHRGMRQQRRGATSEKERFRANAHRRFIPSPGLGEDAVHENVHALRRLARDAVKIAIVTLVETARDVDVQTLYLNGGENTC